MISLATLIRNRVGFGKKPGKWGIASSDGIVLSDATRQAIVRIEEGITEQLAGAVEVSWQLCAGSGWLDEEAGAGRFAVVA